MRNSGSNKRQTSTTKNKKFKRAARSLKEMQEKIAPYTKERRLRICSTDGQWQDATTFASVFPSRRRVSLQRSFRP